MRRFFVLDRGERSRRSPRGRNAKETSEITPVEDGVITAPRSASNLCRRNIANRRRTAAAQRDFLQLAVNEKCERRSVGGKERRIRTLGSIN